MQHFLELDQMKHAAQEALVGSRDERARKEIERRERNRSIERSLVERLALPGSPELNEAAQEELRAGQEAALQRQLEERLMDEIISQGSGSPTGSPLAYPRKAALLCVLPAGSTELDGALNTTPVEIRTTHPAAVELGETVYIQSRHSFGKVESFEPGHGTQFRVQFKDGGFLWCDLSDVCEHGPHTTESYVI